MRAIAMLAALLVTSCVDEPHPTLGSPIDGILYECVYSYIGSLDSHFVWTYAPTSADAEIKVRLNMGRFCCPVDKVSCVNWSEDSYVDQIAYR